MTNKVRMIAPRLTVLMDDGAIHEIQANNYDMLIWERTRQRKYGSPQECQVEWMTWLAWHGLHREGMIDVPYDTFAEHCASIDPAVEETDPTQPVPETG